MSDLIHLTLDTGHVRHSPRSEVSDEAIRAITPILCGGPIPGPWGWQLVAVDLCEMGAAWSVAVDDHYLVMFALAPHAAAAPVVWDVFKLLWGYAAKKRRPPMPGRTPWLAVALGLELSGTCGHQLAALGDLERCVAWAWLDSHRQSQ